jgi:hypothetical protein
LACGSARAHQDKYARKSPHKSCAWEAETGGFIEILLRKSLPDLQAVELSGGLGIKTHEEWLDELSK